MESSFNDKARAPPAKAALPPSGCMRRAAAHLIEEGDLVVGPHVTLDAGGELDRNREVLLRARGVAVRVDVEAPVQTCECAQVRCVSSCREQGLPCGASSDLNCSFTWCTQIFFDSHSNTATEKQHGMQLQHSPPTTKVSLETRSPGLRSR